MASPKETLWAYSLGGTWTGLSMLWCIRCQKAIPAFEGNSSYSLLGWHFSVSGFKQRQMIAVEDMANELAPSGSPVTHTMSAPGRWCHSPWCQCLSRTHGWSGIAAIHASATKTSCLLFTGNIPSLEQTPFRISHKMGVRSIFLAESSTGLSDLFYEPRICKNTSWVLASNNVKNHTWAIAVPKA